MPPRCRATTILVLALANARAFTPTGLSSRTILNAAAHEPREEPLQQALDLGDGQGPVAVGSSATDDAEALKAANKASTMELWLAAEEEKERYLDEQLERTIAARKARAEKALAAKEAGKDGSNREA